MNTNDILALVEPWRLLWNGDLSYTERIIHPEWVAHAAPITGGAPGDATGSESLNAWVGGIQSAFRGLDFQLAVGPITDGEYLVVRWEARGTYTGGIPGTSPDAVGRTITFTGTDTLRVQDGLLIEYWANADSLWFAQQLGMPVPALA